jgi:hypothetical protein
LVERFAAFVGRLMRGVVRDYAGELPTWLEVDSRQHFMIPYTLDANDFGVLVRTDFAAPDTHWVLRASAAASRRL